MLDLFPIPFNLTLIMVAISYYCYNNWKTKNKFKEYLPVLIMGVGTVVGIGGGWVTYINWPDWGLWGFWYYFSLAGLMLFLIFSTRLIRAKKKDFDAAHARKERPKTGKMEETGAGTLVDTFIILALVIYGFVVFYQISAQILSA